jgi:hypothetical protein
VVTAAGHADAPAGADAFITMQANLVGSEFISSVFMSLDPAISLSDISFALHAKSDAATNLTGILATAQDAQSGSAGINGFDIQFQYQTKNSPAGGRFQNSEIVTIAVDCTGASCGGFSVNSFNFAETSNTGTMGGQDFRICVRVQGVGAKGEGSDAVCGTMPANGVPEPSTVLLLGASCLGLAAAAWRRSRRERVQR